MYLLKKETKVPSLFNAENNKKFRNLASAAATTGEDTVGKVIAKGISLGYKTIIGAICGVIMVIGFIVGSFNVRKHLEKSSD
jgi:hypothetical protein